MSVTKSQKKIISIDSESDVASRLSYLENNEYKVIYFESVSAASGTVTIPTGATILLTEFQGGESAYPSTISNSEPTGDLPQTAGGAAITVSSFDASGNYTLSGTPSSYPVAIIYCIKIKAIYWQNLTTDNIVDFVPVNINLLSGITGYTGSGTLIAKGTSPTFTTDITTPLIIGGSAVGSNITYKSTSGTGTTTAAAHTFTGGTNGGTTLAAYFNNGRYIGYSNITSGSGLVVGNEYKGYFYSGAASQHGVSFVSAYTVTGESTITQSNGLLTAIYHDKGFTLPEWQGIETGAAFVDGAGSVITNAWGLAAHLPTCSAGGSVTNAAGIFIKSMASTGITNPFAIYSESVYNSVFAGAVTLGSTTPLTSSLVNLRVNKGTSFIEIGEVSAGIGAIWGNQSSLSSTNYALGFNGSTITELQSSNDIRFKISGTINYRIQGTTQIFSPSAATSGAITPFTFTIAASTGQTASTEISNFKVNGASKTWAAGAITTQRWNYFTANTAAFASASTITNSYGLYVEAATAGSNCTITNNWALGADGAISSTVGYGRGATPTSSRPFNASSTVAGEYSFFITNLSSGVSAQAALRLGNNNAEATIGLASTNATLVNGLYARSLNFNQYEPGGFSFTQQGTATSGAWTTFLVNSGTYTGQTASTNIPNFIVNGSTKTWAAGTITNQYWNYFTANTAAFASASTITNSYGLYVEKATAGTNATITNNWALGTNGDISINGTKAAKITDTNFSVKFLGSVASYLNPADSTTYYIGTTGYAMGVGTRGKIYVPMNCKIVGFTSTAIITTTVSSSETFTLDVYINGTTAQTLSNSMKLDAVVNVYNGSGLSISLNAGDYIETRILTPAWATNPVGVTYEVTLFLQST